MSTFGALNTAYRGLSAAQQAMDLAGQNIDNAATAGYTRQRVQQSSLAALPAAGPTTAPGLVGQGVSVDGIQRLGNALLDTSVRSTAAAAGYAAQRSAAYQGIETTLAEPGPNGVAAQLGSFWASWQDLANQPDNPAAASTVIAGGQQLAATLSTGYKALGAQWDATHTEAQDMVGTLNGAAAQIASLNKDIRSTLAGGGNANELIDARAKLTEQVASLAGGSVRDLPDGTETVYLGGNALVAGDTARTVQLAGAGTMADTASGAPALVWADTPGQKVSLDGGTIAGDLSVLAPANSAGTGGPIAEAAAQYNAFAASLAQAVNTAHEKGQTSTGATGTDFFRLDPALPPAAGLSVIPTGPAGVAAAAAGSGAYDGSNADAISQIRNQAGSPDAQWSGFVTATGAASQSAQTQQGTSTAAATTAKGAQTSQASVSLDEESTDLLQAQHGYQAAARVMSAIDQALDTLINHTGTVGL